MKMKNLKLSLLGASVAALLCGCAKINVEPSRLVILHTNDTHSHLDPVESNDLGGVARRKVLIDSVRAAEPNVMLVDAGDVVQGTLYFHLYKGAAEQDMINRLGYDIQILGNHEFDNGTESMARMLRGAVPTLIATNYEIADSCPLAGIFVPYAVKEYDGRRIGIFSVNIDPKGMIAEGNYDGLRYIDWREVVQPTVDKLRNEEKADAVIAVTHIGFIGREEGEGLFGDDDIARSTTGIDIIIGSHSHSQLAPNTRLANAEGDSVLVVQTGRYGEYLGEIDLDLTTMKATSKLIAVDSRLDSRRDPELMKALDKWRAGVDSLYVRDVATVAPDAGDLNSRNPAMLNYAADFVAARGRQLDPAVVGAITNKGGLRTTWRPGALTEGAAIDMMPFANKVVVIDISGSDLLDALAVMAARGGDAVSSEFNVTFNPADNSIVSATIGGKPIDKGARYRIATIDYLANGGDYMTPFTRAELKATSRRVAYADLIDYLKSNPVVKAPNNSRMTAL